MSEELRLACWALLAVSGFVIAPVLSYSVSKAWNQGRYDVLRDELRRQRESDKKRGQNEGAG